MSEHGRVGSIVRLVPSKLRPPVVEGRIRRRGRIDLLLDEGKQVTLVVGPAGYGKTMAVAQWTERACTPVAWLSIDAHDRPSERFWRYVAAAFGSAVPPLGDETIQSLDDWGPQGFDVVATLLAELGEERQEAVLVLDDVHQLVDESSLEQLAFFLERSPSWLRTILISRSDPSLPLARWRAQGVLSEIRQQALALTTAEAREVIDGFEGLVLGDADAELLIARTEGWAAALQLAGLSLAGRDDATRFLRDVLGTDRVLFDYVVAEVLDRLASDERDAVLALSLLDDIDGVRCSVMTGVADGELLLRRLVQRGLPIVPLDTEQRAVRFHQLFRDLVLNELVLRHPEGLTAFHHDAAEAESAAGDTRAAVRHYLAADDAEAAFQLVVTPVWDLYRSGRSRDAAVWLEQFPEEFVAEDPGRMLSYAVALSFVGRLEDAARWNERAMPLVQGDVELSAELAISWMLVHLGWADTAAVRGDFARLGVLKPGGRFDWDPTGRVITIMALAALVDEDLEEASTWVEVIEAASSLPERARMVGRPARQAWLATERGLLAEAERFADASLSCAGPELAGAGHALVEAFAIKARLAAERAEVDEADGWAERAIDLAAELGAPLHQAIAREAMVAAIEARAGAEEALRRLEHVTRSARFTPALRSRHALLCAELLARSGRYGDAEQQIAGQPADPRRALVVARIAADRGSVAELQDLLAVDPRWPARRRIEAELLRHRAQPGEETHLRRALELGVTAGFVTTFLREGPSVAADLRRAVWGDQTWRSSRLARALRDRSQARPVDLNPLVEPLSDKELQVLQALPSHLSAIEIASQAFVSVNTLRTHIKAIYRKLGVNTRSEAVRRALALGLVTNGEAGTSTPAR